MSPNARDIRSHVCVVIPVLNEAHVLADSVATVVAFLRGIGGYRCRLVIADNGSTDGTHEVASELAARHDQVDLLRLNEKGRGRALRRAWQSCASDIVCYMDVDLSTELEALPKVLDAIDREGYDIAIGSRLMRDSQIVRSFQREVISRVYNLVLKLVLRTSFSDAQCGFKAASRRVVEEVVPQVEDESWFFDTELLVLSQRLGYAIKDIPVRWNEDDDSRVKIIRTGWDDLKGVWRLRIAFWKQSWAGRRASPSPFSESRTPLPVDVDRSEARDG